MTSRRERQSQILTKATRIFGSYDEARRWMRQPVIGLNQQVPRDLVQTLAGAALVETYLNQIDHAVYV